MKTALFVIAYALIFIMCNPTDTILPFPGFDTEGHRGCRGLMPENTTPAMLYAVDLNVTTLEMDVHITNDLKVVLSHDAWFNADITTKPDGSFIQNEEQKIVLFNLNYDSIRKYDVGYKPYPKFPQQKKLHVAKPLLTDVTDVVESYCKQQNKNVWYNIEIKSSPEGDDKYHPQPKKFVELVMRVIKKKKIQQKVIIQSFDFRPLRYMHAKYLATKTSALINKQDKRTVDEIIKDLGFSPAIISPEYTLVTPKLIEECHKKSIRVIPWTVNDTTEMKRLKNMGVDGLISDYPNLYKNL